MKWIEIGNKSDFFVLEYQASGYARTNCCAIGTQDGYLILSPASNVTEEHLKFLEDRKRILALLPPHPGHTLGIKDWKKLRPNLPVYAAPGGIARLKKVTKLDVRPISELKVSDPDIKIWLAPGMKNMTLFAESRKGDRPVAYVDELLEDLDRYPGPLILRPLMWYLGKKPGFQINRGFRFFVGDLKALANEILRVLKDNPYAVFAHGPVRHTAEDLAMSRAMIESLIENGKI